MKIRATIIATCLALLPLSGQAAEAIKIAWLPALTGPLSATTIVMDQGVRFGVDEINKKGGINGHLLELIIRDTVGDPTKAINAVKQVIFQEGAQIVIGPTYSGEALAAIPLIASNKRPNIIASSLEQLTDPEKMPYAFRMFPTNQQFIDAATNYAVNVMKLKKIAIVADTTGYGANTAKQVEATLAKLGTPAVATILIDPNKTDLTDEVAKLRAAGADAISPWSAATGLLGRLLNATRDTGWQVPVVGHPALSGAPILKLLNKPEYWDNVFAVGYATSARDASGHVPAPTEALMAATRANYGGNFDFTFWWFAMGYDTIKIIEAALVKTGGSTDPEAFRRALEQTTALQGTFATYGWSPTNRDGFPTSQAVVVRASSFKDGLFDAAPR